MKRMILALAMMLPLAACGGNRSLDLYSKPLELDIAKTADPESVRMLPVTFRVVTRDNLDTFISEMAALQGTNNVVFIAMTTRDYENISLNFADLRRYIEQQKSIILYYRNMTSKTESPKTN